MTRGRLLENSMTRSNHGIYQESNLNRKLRSSNVKGCIQWTQRHVGKGGKAFLLTIMFEPMPGNERAKIGQMRKELEVLGSRLLLHYNRKPNSIFHAHKTPALYGFPDRPIYKREKLTLENVSINDGIHYHLICLEPTESRSHDSLDEHFEKEAYKYYSNSRIIRIDVQLITHDEDAVTSYGLKAYSSGQFQHDDFLILPRSRSEMPGRTFQNFRKLESISGL
jgi:hypothetical protein